MIVVVTSKRKMGGFFNTDFLMSSLKAYLLLQVSVRFLEDLDITEDKVGRIFHLAWIYMHTHFFLFFLFLNRVPFFIFK